MQAKILRGLSRACMVAGDVSLVGSVALYMLGRSRNDLSRQNDGIFVGLWVPTFYILSDRAALAAAELEREEVTEEFGPTEGLEAQSERAQAALPRGAQSPLMQQAASDSREGVEVQSPRPLQFTRKD